MITDPKRPTPLRPSFYNSNYYYYYYYYYYINNNHKYYHNNGPEAADAGELGGGAGAVAADRIHKHPLQHRPVEPRQHVVLINSII